MDIKAMIAAYWREKLKLRPDKKRIALLLKRLEEHASVTQVVE